MTDTNRLLGYPADGRLLIINADDFGMCHSVNEAIIGGYRNGIIRSTSLMVPCPWSLHAMQFLGMHPELPFGVHLTVVSEWADYRWGPVSPIGEVPNLIDENGYFHNFDQMSQFLGRVSLEQLDMEFRAQIEIVLAAGLRPTHLDWHCLRLKDREDISGLMLNLAKEYGLALRVAGQSWIDTLQRQGYPTNDHDFLDSYLLDPHSKNAKFIELLRQLPVGLNEWAVHPGLDSPELFAIESDADHIRQTDFDFLTSKQAEDVIKEEGIILLDYRRLQEIWCGMGE